MSDHWIQTYTGKAFDLLNPDPSQVYIDDIAHSLSQICRYNGHSVGHVSVAQHSVLIADMLAMDGASVEVQRWGLLHDAAEAYCGDTVRPLKSLLTELAGIESRIMDAICVRFGMDVNMPTIVKEYDERIVTDERRDVMLDGDKDWGLTQEALGVQIWPWERERAKRNFLRKFFSLFPNYNAHYIAMNAIQQEVE